MDAELRAYLALTRRLPRVKGAGAVANVLKRAYGRRPRDPVLVDVGGFTMRLEPREAVDRELLFAPHLYDQPQIDLLFQRVRPGDTFLDVGANIGYYALLASRAVGAAGRVVAIEADPYNHAKLSENVRANRLENVSALHVGVSDKEETLRLSPGIYGNRGGSTFLYHETGTVAVPCRPLKDVLEDAGVERVDAMKIDIEGFEHRVLARFFDDAPRALWPRVALVERHPDLIAQAGGDVLVLLQRHGYAVVWSKDGDLLLARQDNI